MRERTSGTWRRGNPQSLAAILSDTIDPRPADYHGTHMRSMLEADFAMHLDLSDAVWSYEPRTFGVPGERYLPDFLITRSGRPLYVEVKPTLAEVRRAKARMETIWTEEPDAELMVACAEGSTFFVASRGQPWESFVELWKHS